MRPAAKVTLLPEKWEAIAETNAAGIPIVAQTELYHQETGLRAILEYPVKTMNISVPKKMYQVDTGPVAFPDLTRRTERLVDCLSLAFVAFNAPHTADFVTEQPTPVDPNDPESPSHHRHTITPNRSVYPQKIACWQWSCRNKYFWTRSRCQIMADSL